MVHKPVMRKEVMRYLDLKPGDTVVDCTVGAGGHSLDILRQITPGGKLIGIDQDKEILQMAKVTLKDYKNNYELIYGNFRNLDDILNGLNIKKVDAVLYDLGVSSYQLDRPERGFSFMKEGPLDMRMDQEIRITAFDLVNNLSKEELRKIISKYGQERYAERIAGSIIKQRKKAIISTTTQLADIIKRAIPHRARYRIHPATRTFQAFRIAVNDELESLETGLDKTINFLKDKSCIGVISFQSLEDRIVKLKFKKFAKEKILKILTKKPIRASEQETEKNHKARSAKLRAAIKVS